MTNQMEEKTRAELFDHDYFSWRKLSKLTMARLILFNKRRGGEVSRLLLKTYKERPNWKESMNNEILTGYFTSDC